MTAADELGVTVGDRVVVLGQPFTVSGLSADGTNIERRCDAMTSGN